MVAQEYKNIVKSKYISLFMPHNYMYSCEVYNNYVDVWLADIKLDYLPSVYIPFIFEKFPLQITMWYEDDEFNSQKKVWKTN